MGLRIISLSIIGSNPLPILGAPQKYPCPNCFGTGYAGEENMAAVIFSGKKSVTLYK